MTTKQQIQRKTIEYECWATQGDMNTGGRREVFRTQGDKHAVKFSRGKLSRFLQIFLYLLGTFGNISYICHR